MGKLKSLQLKRLLKELDYIESELEYRSELINEADSQFLLEINYFLEENPELKKIYNNIIDVRVEQIINKKVQEKQKFSDEVSGGEDEDLEEQQKENNEDEENKIIISPKIRSLYREIVKITHPDISKKKDLNDIYINATKFYSLNDKVGIYKICSDLNINYEVDEEDEKDINQKINDTKDRIIFIESTLTWKWFNENDEQTKKRIMLDYIKLRMFS
jgi:hypothetical protein